MTTILYDGSYSGLMTVIFDCYEQKLTPVKIEKENNCVRNMFDTYYEAITSDEKVSRVMKVLREKLSSRTLQDFHKAFHSGLPDVEMTIFHYIKLTLLSREGIERDYRQAPVIHLKQIVKMMDREIHRMHAFVRFQRTSDNIYAATIEPDFDVIPFIGDHFKKRYRDQLWLIYDTRRDYGIYYGGGELDEVRLEDPQWAGNKRLKRSIMDESESEVQDLWKDYFAATNIKERKNLKLHLRHVPRRYWRHLPEKWALSA